MKHKDEPHKLSFCDWFDPDNIEHIQVYEYLKQNGHWKKGFIKKYHDLENNWQILLAFKLADKWVQHMIDEENHHYAQNV